jgi:hypothetical protein
MEQGDQTQKNRSGSDTSARVNPPTETNPDASRGENQEDQGQAHG